MTHHVKSQGFMLTCNTGCVQNASWWQSQPTSSWPSGSAVQPTTTFCGQSASSILSAFTSDTQSAPAIVVEFIAANLNSANGACLTVSSTGAISNLQNEFNEANAGDVPTRYTSIGCSQGYTAYVNALSSNYMSESLGQTLIKYNLGVLYGPCACSNPGCRTITSG